MSLSLKPSQRVGILGAIDSQSANAAKSTGWIAAANFFNFLALIAVGALGASATVDAKLEQATSAAGADAKDITGKAITQLTKAGTDDNKQVLINLKQDELDIANGFTHFRLTVTPAVAASQIFGCVMGLDPRYNSASDNDATTVDEIVG